MSTMPRHMPKPKPPMGGISPTAPPPYRAQKQKIGMGPQGVGGSQTPFAPPRAPMMASGGIGIPAPIGKPSGMMPPDMDAGAPDMPPPDQGSGQMPVISPEAVGYTDTQKICGPVESIQWPGCKYMGSDGQCAVLQMQVSPTGGCQAGIPVDGGDQDQDDMTGAEPGTDDGSDAMGTSGGNQ